MGGLEAKKYRADARREPAELALLHRISLDLIRAPHHSLGNAIEGALAQLGEALAADRVLFATRAPNGFGSRYLWERRRTAARSRAPDDTPDSILDQLELEYTLVCTNRSQFPPELPAGVALSAQISSAIFVPLHNGKKARAVLAVTARAPRAWSSDAVRAVEWLAQLLGACLDRMATHSSFAREQERRLHAEAETRRLRDQLAHAGRVTMLGELAASLAHELNQPLTAIYTNAQAAHRLLERKPAALGEACEALHDLGQDCRRAGDVLGRLRQMFRRQETERVPLEVGPLVQHVLKLLHEDAVARNVNVAVDIRPRLPLVKGDRVQLEQVLMNLLVNAFDAVSAVETPREVVVRAHAREGRVEVAVLDTGRGIARSELERIFEPFFTRKPRGMGMGLAICRTIAEAHGGSICARNRTERGAVFELNLPALPADAVTGEPP